VAAVGTHAVVVLDVLAWHVFQGKNCDLESFQVSQQHQDEEEEAVQNNWVTWECRVASSNCVKAKANATEIDNQRHSVAGIVKSVG